MRERKVWCWRGELMDRCEREEGVVLEGRINGPV